MDLTLEDQINNQTLNTYLKKLLVINESINLTRVTDYNDAKLLHLEDSLLVLEEFENAPEGKYGDMGSGCGFPGVALSIASGRNAILIDSAKKKMTAVGNILKEMKLQNQIETCSLRIEELAKSDPESFSVLTARALSSLPSLLELASPLLERSGQLIALKAHVSEDELQAALNVKKQTGMKLISHREFYLSDGETFRSVYVFEKFAKPTIKLPRRVGLAQRNPLIG